MCFKDRKRSNLLRRILRKIHSWGNRFFGTCKRSHNCELVLSRSEDNKKCQISTNIKNLVSKTNILWTNKGPNKGIKFNLNCEFINDIEDLIR